MGAARCRIGSDLSGVLPPRAWEPLGFHDGPLSGVIACGCCGAEYVFDTPDWPVDGARLRRFFAAGEPALAQLRAGGDYAGLTQMLAARAGELRAVALTDAWLERGVCAVSAVHWTDERLRSPFGGASEPDGALVRCFLDARGR